MEVENVGDFCKVGGINDENQEVFSYAVVCFQLEASKNRCSKDLNEVSIWTANLQP